MIAAFFILYLVFLIVKIIQNMKSEIKDYSQIAQ
ncbi:hypothetical protein FLCH110379_22365 [Flavobacterium chungbukense]